MARCNAVASGDSFCPISFLAWLGKRGVGVWGQSILRCCFPILLLPVALRTMSSDSSQCSRQLKDHDEPVAVKDAPSATCDPPVLSVVSTAFTAAVGDHHEKGEQQPSCSTRISKIKAALVLGYNGSRFSGLQRNPGQYTIEDVVEEAV
jgi:hypothetical protein